MTPRVVVTGATGFLGRHLLPILSARYGLENVRGVGSRDYDLTESVHVRRMFRDLKPAILVHLAAYSGGIGANREWPADFYHQNMLLTTLVFREAALHKVRKLIYTMGGCSYPVTARSPIDEGQMWDGLPQADSLGYSMAKKMGIVASVSYRRQYGLPTVVLVPGNMYGEYDNFRAHESHVIPAMVRRYYEARQRGAREVMMWGTGTAVRDFVYAGDVAAVVPYFIEHYDSEEPVNVSTGTRTSIRELSELLRGIVGFEGDIVWDSSKPEGQLVKIFDPSRLRSLGLSCPMDLAEGLRRTVGWLEKNYAGGTDGIRL